MINGTAFNSRIDGLGVAKEIQSSMYRELGRKYYKTKFLLRDDDDKVYDAGQAFTDTIPLKDIKRILSKFNGKHTVDIQRHTPEGKPLMKFRAKCVRVEMIFPLEEPAYCDMLFEQT